MMRINVRMKKGAAAMLAFVLLAVSAAGCSGNSSEEKEESRTSQAVSSVESKPAEKSTLRIAALKGPTGLGLLHLMDQNDAGTAVNQYEFTIAGSPDEIVSKISTGEVDAAAVPTNLASVLYNKTEGKVQIAALNTLGVLYVVTNGESVGSIADLKGKTVYSSGQGSVPEYALNYILSKNGLEAGRDVTVEYKAEHSELATLLVSGDASIAVLPEPFVTQVMNKNPDIQRALDLTQEWDRASEEKSVLTMGCLIVRKDFAEQNKAAFDSFLNEYQASVAYTNEKVKETAALSEKYDIMPAAVAEKAIPNCNIVYLDGADLKAKLPDFLNILLESNAKSIGGKLPGDDFYYER